MSPTIFNVVVDVVIHHWVTVVTPAEVGMGGLGLTIIDLEEYFYADDSLVASNQPESLQRAFEVLVDLFNLVGIWKNTEKIVGMVCQPCHLPGGMSEEAYKIRTAGKGPTFQEHQKRRVECPECGVEVEAGFILNHC